MKGSREIGFTIISISISLVAVFIPVLLMGGVVGRIFNEFAVVVTVAILASTFVSLTLTPMLCSRLPAVADRKTNAAASAAVLERGFDAVLRGYDRALEFCLPLPCCSCSLVFLRHDRADGLAAQRDRRKGSFRRRISASSRCRPRRARTSPSTPW